jgi:hypothetical protein
VTFADWQESENSPQNAGITSGLPTIRPELSVGYAPMNSEGLVAQRTAGRPCEKSL